MYSYSQERANRRRKSEEALVTFKSQVIETVNAELSRLGACAWCGSLFVKARRGPGRHKVYCSKECARAAEGRCPDCGCKNPDRSTGRNSCPNCSTSYPSNQVH